MHNRLDLFAHAFLKQVRQATNPACCSDMRQRFSLSLQLQDGLLFHVMRLVLLIPDLHRTSWEWSHAHPTAGHFGTKQTLALLLCSIWWPAVRADGMTWARLCYTCQRQKSSWGRPVGLLQPLSWHSVAFDFITYLSSQGSLSTIWVVVDLLTKTAHFVACSRLPIAATLASMFFQNIYRLHGLQRFLLSDRGSQFTMAFWKALTKLLHIDHRYSTAYHPQTDGKSE